MVLTPGLDLGLTLTQHVATNELTILLLIIILISTMFFCYNIIRLCLIVVRGDKGSSSSPSRGRPALTPAEMLKTGYAMPRRPIRVVLAQDEEVVTGRDGEANKLTPPAYGFWRESVVSTCTFAAASTAYKYVIGLLGTLCLLLTFGSAWTRTASTGSATKQHGSRSLSARPCLGAAWCGRRRMHPTTVCRMLSTPWLRLRRKVRAAKSKGLKAKSCHQESGLGRSRVFEPAHDFKPDGRAGKCKAFISEDMEYIVLLSVYYNKLKKNAVFGTEELFLNSTRRSCRGANLVAWVRDRGGSGGVAGDGRALHWGRRGGYMNDIVYMTRASTATRAQDGSSVSRTASDAR